MIKLIATLKKFLITLGLGCALVPLTTLPCNAQAVPSVTFSINGVLGAGDVASIIDAVGGDPLVIAWSASNVQTCLRCGNWGACTTLPTLSGTETVLALNPIAPFSSTGYLYSIVCYDFNNNVIQSGVQVNTTAGPVLPPALVIGQDLADGQVGSAYSFALHADGGVPPYNFAAAGLPLGLNLAGSIISGIPTNSGTFSVALSVTDSTGVTVSTNAQLKISSPPVSGFTAREDGKGIVTAFGAGYIQSGSKFVLYDANTQLRINGGLIKIGMSATWRGLRDPNTGVVLASRLELK